MNIDQLIEELQKHKETYGGQCEVIVETSIDYSVPFEGELNIDEVYNRGNTTDKPVDTSKVFIRCSN